MAKKMKFGADPREEGVTGGPRNTPMNPERKEVLKRSAEENARNRSKAEKGKTMKYAKGGSVSKRADGVAKKGKTHTKMVTMAKGGMTKKGCK